jgi:hypothetical protein
MLTESCTRHPPDSTETLKSNLESRSYHDHSHFIRHTQFWREFRLARAFSGFGPSPGLFSRLRTMVEPVPPSQRSFAVTFLVLVLTPLLTPSSRAHSSTYLVLLSEYGASIRERIRNGSRRRASCLWGAQ